MTDQGRRLLRLLSDFLRTVPPDRFDLDYWASAAGGRRTFAPDACGTTACAIGWACTLPAFNAAGLRLDGVNPSYLDQDGFERRGWAAADRVFGISRWETSHLFESSTYPDEELTPAHVADRIDAFLAARPEAVPAA